MTVQHDGGGGGVGGGGWGGGLMYTYNGDSGPTILLRQTCTHTLLYIL